MKSANSTRPQRGPSVREVTALTLKMKPDHLQCRDYGHSWRPQTAYREGSEFVRVLCCGNCDTIKRQRLSRHGGILGSSMSYPEGYLFHNIGRIVGPAKDAVRLASLQLEFKVD